MPAGSVWVGRPGRWGSWIEVGGRIAPAEWAGGPTQVRSYAHATELYAAWLRASPGLVQQIRAELAGRDLVCWCPSVRPCHADVLLRVAAGGDP